MNRAGYDKNDQFQFINPAAERNDPILLFCAVFEWGGGADGVKYTAKLKKYDLTRLFSRPFCKRVSDYSTKHKDSAIAICILGCYI
jgi:hypothetical protein